MISKALKMTISACCLSVMSIRWAMRTFAAKCRKLDKAADDLINRIK
jgi:hypothetical protein